MESLLALDQQLFLVLNHLPHTPFLDGLAQFFSGLGNAGIVWFVLGVILFIREEKKDHNFFMPILLAVGASWILVEKITKPLVARSRPALELGAIIIGDGQTDFSFPSSHATIAWAMATLFAAKEPRWRWVFFVLAAFISFSRIYLGKHYPFDVVAGGLLGWGIGTVIIRKVGIIRTW